MRFPHGDLRCYREDACRCTDCLAAAARYERRRNKMANLYGPAWVDATGTMRRLQALMANGWTSGELTRRLGQRSSHGLQIGKFGRVHRDTAAKVAALYGELEHIEGPSQRARALYRNRGYLPPGAWDAATIDDPAANPLSLPPVIDRVAVVLACEGERVPLRKAERVAAVQRLVALGFERTEIADRLHMSGGRVKQILDASSSL